MIGIPFGTEHTRAPSNCQSFLSTASVLADGQPLTIEGHREVLVAGHSFVIHSCKSVHV